MLWTTKGSRALLAACTAIICGGATAASNDVVSVRTELPDMVVTATREPRDPHQAPATVYRLDADRAVQQQAVRSTPEVLDGVPSAMVQKTAYGQGSPYLRGFTGFRTLMLIDGVRLNNSVFRDGPNQYWNTVDPLSVRDYELVMGPASVLYGSDAVGGTLNALTVDPPAWSGEPDWEGRALYRGSTAESSHAGRLQLGGRPSEQLGLVAGLSVKRYGDLRGGADVGRQRHTGYDELDFDGKLVYDLDPDSSLTLGHQTVNQEDAWRTHRTPYGLTWRGLSTGSDKRLSLDQHRDLTWARLQQTPADGLFDGISITASRQAQQEDQHRTRQNDSRDSQGFDVTTWGLDTQFRSTDTAVGDLVYGIEYYRDDVDSYSRRYSAGGRLTSVDLQGPVADDASYDTLGAYLQDTLELGDAGTTLVPGVRYTRVWADADTVKDPLTGARTALSGEWDAWVGSLRLLQPLDAQRDWVIFAGVSQGFRAPNLSDLTRFDIARSTEIETPSPDLEPERFLSGEVGLKVRGSRGSVQLAGYQTHISRMIVRTPTGRVLDGNNEVTKRNAGDGYVRGVEGSGRLDLGAGFSAWLAASWMAGRVDAYPSSDAAAVRDTVTRLMPPTAQAGLRWTSTWRGFWAEVAGDCADRANRLSADDRRDTQRIPPGGTPGYAVCHARAGLSLAEGLALALALENLFDVDYRIHGSGLNEPGRNLVATLSCAF